jgi:hypothetical protein
MTLPAIVGVTLGIWVVLSVVVAWACCRVAADADRMRGLL